MRGGWRLEGNPPLNAVLYLVTAADKQDRWEGEVCRNGQRIETLTGPTREHLVAQLDRRYGPSDPPPARDSSQAASSLYGRSLLTVFGLYATSPA